MKFVSLFAGIGGIDLGLERAGHECVLQVEIDEFCQRVLAKHWPDVRRIADVHDVTAEDCEGADLLAGGFPCQPVSVAGKRLGTADERWLWPEFERLIGVVRPGYVLVENVPGLFVRGFDDVLSGLAALGYDAEWEVVSAADVGAPHLRERVWLVAYPGCERRQTARGERPYPSGEGSARRAQSGRGQGDASWKGPVRGAREDSSGALADTDSKRSPRSRQFIASSNPTAPEATQATQSLNGGLVGQWAVEPTVGRVAYGVPHRVERLRALGNAVVPQVAELIGHRLKEIECGDSHG